MQQKRAQSGRTGRVVVMEILIIIVSVIASAGAAAAPWLFARYRQMANRVRALEEKIEDVSDRNWELRDAAERARSLVQAQGECGAMRAEL